jgi:quinol monooxygenase YgiN
MLSIRHWLLALLILAPAAFPGSVVANTDQQQFVVVYVEFLPAKAAQGGQQLEQLAGLARAAAGIISFNVNQEIQRPNFYSLVETWNDAAAYQAFVNSSQTQAMLNAIQPLLEAPLDERAGNLVE